MSIVTVVSSYYIKYAAENQLKRVKFDKGYIFYQNYQKENSSFNYKQQLYVIVSTDNNIALTYPLVSISPDFKTGFGFDEIHKFQYLNNIWYELDDEDNPLVDIKECISIQFVGSLDENMIENFKSTTINHGYITELDGILASEGQYMEFMEPPEYCK